VQVKPIKPTSKPPGIKRLKLNCDSSLSNYAFKFSMRHYTMEKYFDSKGALIPGAGPKLAAALGRAVQVDPIRPALKGAGIKRLKLKHYKLLSNLPFKFDMRRYS